VKDVGTVCNADENPEPDAEHTYGAPGRTTTLIGKLGDTTALKSETLKTYDADKEGVYVNR